MLVQSVAHSLFERDQYFMPVRDLPVEKLSDEGKHMDTGYHTGQHVQLLENSSVKSDPDSLDSYLLPQKPLQCTSEKASLLQSPDGFKCVNCGRMCAQMCTGRELYKTVLQMQQYRQHVDRMFEDDTSVKTYSVNSHDWKELHVGHSTSISHRHCRKKQLEHHQGQTYASSSSDTATDITALNKETFSQAVQDTEPHSLDHKERDRRASLKVQHTYPRPFACYMSMSYVGEEYSL